MVPSDTQCDIVFFGVLGDLTQRKLLPALYQLEAAGLLHPDSRIIGLGRDPLSQDEFQALCQQNLQKFIGSEKLDNDLALRFGERLCYQSLSFTEAEGYQQLSDTLAEDSLRTRVFYYATPAALFGEISNLLHQSGCVNAATRVVLEKPIGHDQQSAMEINDTVAAYFDESQIYRIDHYLGKETVQNLLALRFANSLFGTQWNQNYISHVEISVAEKVGIEGRWGYFDQAGQMRDMVQNHLLQLLCLVAMDPPDNLSADSIRDQKVKVLKALRPITADNYQQHVVRGQYVGGSIDGRSVPGYLHEEGANPVSKTETFIALKLEIDNWRWAGVPFYLRTGKRLPTKQSQVIIHFKPQPHFIFDPAQRDQAHNRLIIQLQPDEGISLQIQTKDQGLDAGNRLRSGPLQLNFSETFDQERVADAYERLLLEVIQGNQYLFVRKDEVLHAWQWCDQVLQLSEQHSSLLQPYFAGSWGPEAANKLLQNDGREWYSYA